MTSLAARGSPEMRSHKIIDDHVMEFGPGVSLVGNVVRVQENAVEYLDHVQDAHRDAGLLEQFARNPFLQRFGQLQRPAGYGPLAQQRLAAPADQQGPALLDNHTADTDHGMVRILTCHSLDFLQPVCRVTLHFTADGFD